MPNIMLTYKCNLHCSYCFANEFVNKSNTDITMEHFETAVDFLTKTGNISIGLIGGEPTIHPDFAVIIRKLLDNEKVDDVTIYTNGILLDQYMDVITDPRIRILINCNSPDVIGESSFERIRENIDLLINHYKMKNQINLGINLYSNDMDYAYMIRLLKEFNFHRVRMSVTVPDFTKVSEVSILEYFRDRKEFILKFLKDMDSVQVVPYYDCNKPPFCIWNQNEQEWIKNYVNKYPVKESNLIGNCSQCFPVIDILPDLKAVRCFGLSEYEKVDIKEFKCITDLASYFMNQIDTHAYKIVIDKECQDCYERKTRHCMSGCIGFKAKKITDSNKFYETI